MGWRSHEPLEPADGARTQRRKGRLKTGGPASVRGRLTVVRRLKFE